jgi:hypothetical protein
MMEYLVDHPSNTITMVVPLDTTAEWLCCGKGWMTAAWKRLVKFDDPAKKIIINRFILVFIILPTLSPPKQCINTPSQLPCFCASPPYHHPLRPPVYGWLLGIPLLISGPLRPMFILFPLFICHLI